MELFFKVYQKISASTFFFPNKHSLSTPLREYSLSLLGTCALIKGMPLALKRLNIAKYTNFAILDF